MERWNGETINEQKKNDHKIHCVDKSIKAYHNITRRDTFIYGFYFAVYTSQQVFNCEGATKNIIYSLVVSRMREANINFECQQYVRLLLLLTLTGIKIQNSNFFHFVHVILIWRGRCSCRPSNFYHFAIEITGNFRCRKTKKKGNLCN